MRTKLFWVNTLLIFLLAPQVHFAGWSGTHACAYHPKISQMLALTNPDQWLDWVKQLSGAKPVQIGGKEFTIQTRYTPALFDEKENARAFDFILQQATGWVGKDQVEIETYAVAPYPPFKNLIVTFPGTTRADEVVVLSAHLDSKSLTKPFTQAPGADDNATGAATLLEAVRLFRFYSFQRTIKVIWFSGEEWGMLGSQAYVKEHPASGIVGVINMDMFGYDQDGDRCFELHTGTLPASQAVGACVVQTLQSYHLNLRYDYVTTQAAIFSDHASFWKANIGAVLIMENFFQHGLPQGCLQHDNNPNYHSTQDTFQHLNVPYAFDIARAGIAAVAGLAEPSSDRPLQKAE
jgi:hypothetical protein